MGVVNISFSLSAELDASETVRSEPKAVITSLYYNNVLGTGQWSFSHNNETGLPSFKLTAKTEWHTKLVKNAKVLLAYIEKQFGFKAVGTLGNGLAKTALTNLPLTGEVAVKYNGHGIRIGTVHQVKGYLLEQFCL